MKGLTTALVSLSQLPPAHGAALLCPWSAACQGGPGPCSAAEGSLSFSSAELRVFREEHICFHQSQQLICKIYQASKAIDGFTRV